MKLPSYLDFRCLCCSTVYAVLEKPGVLKNDTGNGQAHGKIVLEQTTQKIRYFVISAWKCLIKSTSAIGKTCLIPHKGVLPMQDVAMKKSESYLMVGLRLLSYRAPVKWGDPHG